MKTITDEQYEEYLNLKEEREQLDWVENIEQQRHTEDEARRIAWNKAIVEDWRARGGRDFGDM